MNFPRYAELRLPAVNPSCFSPSWFFTASWLRVYAHPRKINFHESPQIFTDLRRFPAQNRRNPLPRNAIPRRAFSQSAKPLYRVWKLFFFEAQNGD
jgi:hypothetical protein